ncbi:hypothetical protein BGZ51_005584 [Haplosporangium sp. Z 767]|nr:hypothetical protein BGZ51_005584 [Haplosporangium sp. Z 767]
MQKTFDLTIFGATGFTGKFILSEVLKTAPKAFPGQQLRVAIAGRSRERLEKLVASLPSAENASGIQPAIIVADVQDEASMRAMCRASKTLIAAAGPFRFLGEAVVTACIQEQCHYVDITGEPEFFEKMALQYHEKAKEARVSIIHVCGFDSIPADMGVLYTKQQFEKNHQALPSSIEMFFKLHVAGNAGFAAHYATFESAVHGFGSAGLLRQLRRTANRPQIPKIGPTLQVNPKPHWVHKVAAYTVPFFFADPSVIRLSQQMVLQDKDLQAVQSPPVQFAAYICIPTFKTLALTIMASTVFGMLAKYEFGRKFLLKHPRLFTLGTFSHEGPTKQQLAETSFSETFFAQGFSQELRSKYPNPDELRQVKPDVSIVTSVSGPEPGYVATPKMVVQACYTLLLQKELVPSGVLTPAIAFGKTNLIERLQEQETKFSESFWSNSRGDYVSGLNVLHGKIDQGAVEDQEILTYIRERIDVEQRYGNALIEMGNRRLKLDGFLRDDGASLRRTFETIKAESVELGNGHLTLASNLRELVLQPLLKFSTHARQTTLQSREEIENRLKMFDKHLLDLDRSHATYVAKCNAADQADIEANKIAQEDAAAAARANGAEGGPGSMDMDRRHEFASQRFTIQELNKFLNRMRSEVPSQDVKVPIMGVYNNCCSGSAIAHWIQQNTKARTIEEAEHIGQSLSDEGFLRLIGQRGNKFLASPANFYQWRDQMFELLDEDDSKEEELSLVKRTKQEAEKADAAYMAAVKRADLTRLQLEVGLFSHMDLLQRFEYDRINTFKNAFLNFAAIFSNIISITQSVADHLLIFQEALRPTNDVQYVIEQYRTGAFVPMPTLYNNFYHGSGLDQVFGVNIDKHCNFTRKKVPQIVMKCLTRIKKSSIGLTNEQKLACWTAEVPLADIHILRNKINHGGKITQKLLRLFDVATVVNVLRLYFLELPGSLVNGEEYETVKIIYSNASDDADDAKNDARISSIRNLLALLSSARFYTLYEVNKHVNLLIKETGADESFTNFIAHRWGPVFLRPLEETAVTMHDKHPQRMMRDMIKMTLQIFEPIKMSREEGQLSRSVTTRAPATQLNRRKNGPLRSSKLGLASMMNNQGDGRHTDSQAEDSGVPSIAVDGKAMSESGVPDHGSGVGSGSGPAGRGDKPQRRLGPSSARFNLARGVSAPEVFSGVPAFKKKFANNAAGGDAAAAGQENQTPGLLNTNGLEHAAGGEKSSRSPLRQSLMANSTTPEDIAEEEEDENADTPVTDAAGAPAATEDTQTTHIEAEPIENSPPTAEESNQGSTTEVPAQEVTTDFRPVSTTEFENSGRKLERRRKNRQSALSTTGGPGSDGSPNLDSLSAESVLQALREEENSK